MSPPNGIVAGIARIFNRMSALGLTEPVQVYAKVPALNGDGVAVGRQDKLLTTLTAYVAQGGGNAQPSQEGVYGGALRASDTHEVYSPLDTTGSLTEADYAERWLVLPNRSTRQYRIHTCQAIGPYLYVVCEAGGTSDAGGNLH